MRPNLLIKFITVALLAGTGFTSFAQLGYIYTVAGTLQSGYSGDGGLATAAYLSLANGVATDAADNLYIADFYNGVIRKVNAATGIITTVVGIHDSVSFIGDGGPATAAHLNCPTEVLIDAHNNLIINDGYSHFRIRKVDTSGIITTIAGDPMGDPFTDGIPATNAWLGVPHGMAMDTAGNLYIGVWAMVRKISPSGIITTVAGVGSSGGFSGDGGPALSAHMYVITGIAIDPSGNIFIADQQNHRIRKINTSGIITTIAGIGTAGYTGDGGPATAASIARPYGLKFDASGNLLFNDYGNYAIRKISPSGIITSVAGTGSPSGVCFGPEGCRTDTSCVNPTNQLALDSHGHIYFSNGNNVRVIKSAPTGIQQLDAASILINPNPVSDQLNIKFPVGIYTSIEITNGMGQQVMTNKISTSETTIDVRELPSGVYLVRLKGQKGTILKQFVKM